MRRLGIAVGIAGIVLLLTAAIIFWPLRAIAPDDTSPQPVGSPLSVDTGTTIAPPAENQPSERRADTLVWPVDEFQGRITKKPFGIFITPQNSPVQPERFSGYHTGVDVEYGDIAGEVAVRAITAGTVVASRTATGYGGVIAIEHEINDQTLVAIYGHLDPMSLIAVGTRVVAGEQIGILGDDKTSETDGERKHLHFAVRNDATVSLLGYVKNESDLTAWRDPVEFLNAAE